MKVEPIYYKCVANDWTSFDKGRNYHVNQIGEYLSQYPLDFKPVLPMPTVKELIAAIQTGEGKSKVLKALKQWNY